MVLSRGGSFLSKKRDNEAKRGKKDDGLFDNYLNGPYSNSIFQRKITKICRGVEQPGSSLGS